MEAAAVTSQPSASQAKSPEGGAAIDAVNPSNVEGAAEIRLTRKAIEMAKKAIERRPQPTFGLRLGF